mmetsp:Transcript_8204/g.10430  ORF Transcript_8204/g.10430 Transcript_8204/m.10430 type:complete len:239 (+) Transcript_8204:35-751(+)
MKSSSLLLSILLILKSIDISKAAKGRNLYQSSNAFSAAFSMNMKSNQEQIRRKEEIYNVPGSGWTSPTWNWGYAVGTGHECAMICRNKYDSQNKRADLIHTLMNPKQVSVDVNSVDVNVDVEKANEIRIPPFEEVKLILGLTIQRGRWDGCDGGIGGYGEILNIMAQAKKYESDDEQSNSKLFIDDMVNRFNLIAFDNDDAIEEMMQIQENFTNDYDLMRRKCVGLVLREMKFIESGL